MTELKNETHPVQTNKSCRGNACVSSRVTLRAYEVYCYLFGEQKAMITNGCRGGFSTGELIAFLYARSFPKDEWQMRFDEALRGMENI